MADDLETVVYRFQFESKTGSWETGEIKERSGSRLFCRDDVIYRVLGGINPDKDYDAEDGPDHKVCDGIVYGEVYFRKGTREKVTLKSLARPEVRNGDRLLVEKIREANQTQYDGGVYLLSFRVQDLQCLIESHSVIPGSVSAPN